MCAYIAHEVQVHLLLLLFDLISESKLRILFELSAILLAISIRDRLVRASRTLS